MCVCWRVKVKELKHHFHHPQMLPTKAAVVVMREPYYAYVLCIMPMCLTNCIFKILIKTPPPPPPQPWTDWENAFLAYLLACAFVRSFFHSFIRSRSDREWGGNRSKSVKVTIKASEMCMYAFGPTKCFEEKEEEGEDDCSSTHTHTIGRLVRLRDLTWA